MCSLHTPTKGKPEAGKNSNQEFFDCCSYLSFFMVTELDPTKPLTDSTLNQEEQEEVDPPKYSDKERDYLGRLQKKLDYAKTQHDEPRKEFDNLTLGQYYLENERLANTELKPKKNRADITYQSGSLEDKLMALLSSIQGLNLSPDISAFNEKNFKVNALGNAMEDIIEKTNELEQDEEKKMLRQFELLKQGTYYSEEVWENRLETTKKITTPFDGKIETAKWTPKVSRDKRGQAVRNFIPLTSVYLGDITQYFIEKQPYLFTVQDVPYGDAKAWYGDWERFKNVSKTKREFSGTEGEEMANGCWSLGDMKKGRVQVIKYQDKPNLEYQIILNGVPMLPMGYPFPWGYNEYNITQQNLRPFKRNFAYGKSFIFKNKNIFILLDEMMKLGLLKTQKSFMPAMINTSGRIITSRALMPGKINMHFGKNQLMPVSDKEAEGVTNSEFAMIQELIKQGDRRTVSQSFAGQQEEGGKVTATQILELKRQAQIMMGVVILTMSFMEKKLTSLRLMNILQNWFEPTGNVVDKARDMLRNKYRTIAMQRGTDKGQGIRITAPMDELPTKDQLIATEDRLSAKRGRPVRIIALTPKEVKETAYTWVINVIPKEKKSSELSKLIFQEMVAGGMNVGLQFNPDFLKQKFADIWEEDVNKMFAQGTPPLAPEGAEQGTVKPQIKLGEPKGALANV